MQFWFIQIVFWMFIIIIFLGVCIGIVRDCNKTQRENGQSQLPQDIPPERRRQAQLKQQMHRTQFQTRYVDIQLSMCPECEATILAETTVCPHCGQPQPICIVCSNSIVAADSTLYCPQCKGQAHRIHFLEYLKVKGRCPQCQANLDPQELIDDLQIQKPPRTSHIPKHLCIVCNGPIGSIESTLQCSHCEGKAHRLHFLEFLKVKGVCPNCQTQLDPDELIES